MREYSPLGLLTCVATLLTACAAGENTSRADSESGVTTATATQSTGSTTGPSLPTTTAPGTDSDAGTEGVTDSGSGSLTDGPTTTTATGSTTEAASDSSSTGSTTSPPECDQPLQCTDDLKGLQCEGRFAAACADGAYCIDGACVPLSPCEAAALLKGSEGCEFWAVKTHLTKPASCFAAFIANTWDEPVHIEVEYEGQALDVGSFIKIPVGQGQNITYGAYDPVAGLPPGQVAVAFLSRGPSVDPMYDCPACPVAPAIAEEVEVVDTGRGQGFRIATDRPVAAYQMFPYGGGSAAITAATLLLPTSVWDTNYVVINAYPQSGLLAPAAKPLWAVVATEDATEVTLDPKVAVTSGPGVSGGPADVPIVYNLSRGEVIQFAQAAELTGSPLAANKPVGVFGGANCFNVPIDANYCDGANQQIPPIKALGSTYAAVRYKNRTQTNESPPWRLVGAVDGTTLTWSPAKPSGAPDTLALGQVVEFTDPGPFVVRSQDSEHPFYLAGYMTGGNAYGGRGDPEFVNVIPSEQYLDRYVFFTDPTYSETSLVVVRRKQDGSFADVNLGCAGTLDGWTAIDADHEYTRVDLVTGNFQDVGGCSNGRHEISSLYPIGVTVWGWGGPASVDFYTLNVSYAYPAGAAIRAINDVKIIPQ